MDDNCFTSYNGEIAIAKERERTSTRVCSRSLLLPFVLAMDAGFGGGESVSELQRYFTIFEDKNKFNFSHWAFGLVV